jgi:hypothetical protein
MMFYASSFSLRPLSYYHISDNLISAMSLTGQKLAPSYWANVVACVMASQFGIVAALGMKNNVISCVYTILIHSSSFLTEVVLFCLQCSLELASIKCVILHCCPISFIELTRQPSHHVLA